MEDCCKSFVHLPIIFLILMGGGFFACYGMAISYGHVVSYPGWPYVSDTGATQPESCLFTLLLTWGAFTILGTMYMYYKYVIHHGHQSKVNIAAFIVGCISCFGVTMVGAFQWTAVLVPHLIGAFVAFVGAVIYSWMVVHISLRHMTPSVHGKMIGCARVIVAVMETVSLIVLIIGSALSMNNTAYANLSSIPEWFLIYSALLFLATLMYDLRRIRDTHVRLILHQEVTPTENPNPGTNYSEFILSKH